MADVVGLRVSLSLVEPLKQLRELLVNQVLHGIAAVEQAEDVRQAGDDVDDRHDRGELLRDVRGLPEEIEKLVAEAKALELRELPGVEHAELVEVRNDRLEGFERLLQVRSGDRQDGG